VARGVFYIELGQCLLFAESYGPGVVDNGGLKKLKEVFRRKAGRPSHFQGHEGNVLVVVQEPGMGEVQAVRKTEEEIHEIDLKVAQVHKLASFAAAAEGRRTPAYFW
jgi:hypothetical protein